MIEQDPGTLMFEVLRIREEVDQVALGLIADGEAFFGSLSLRMPKLRPAELGFQRVISWFYVSYFEAGKVNVRFLNDRLDTYGLDASGELREHPATVHQMRTFLQHNINPAKKHDNGVQQFCESWFEYTCKTRVPEDDGQWETCLKAILGDAINFFSGLRNCIRSIERDESREAIVKDWVFRRKRYHAPDEFDRLIEIVAGDMGREAIDAKRLRERNYEKWMKELDLLAGNYEFEIEARKLVEHSLLHQTTSVLPITGADLMREFDIAPGPQIGMLLNEARKLYDADPRPRAALLEGIRAILRFEQP